MKIPNKVLLGSLLLLFLIIGGNAKGQVFSPIAPATNFTFLRNLTLGTRGTDVSALQQFLFERGFLKVASTGYFGTLTRAALGAWQASVGVYPSAGYFGPISRKMISSIVQQAPIIPPPPKGVATTTVPVPVAINATVPTGKPTRLTIPKLNVDAGFQYLGLKSDGTMEIPNNIVDVAWFTGSPLPGKKGNSIITGHVVQILGGVVTKPGVFKNLNELAIGDKLYIQNDRGETIIFAVRETRLYDPSADAVDVFVSFDGKVHLNLITCEGTWNAAQQSYSKRLVVFMDAVAQ